MILMRHGQSEFNLHFTATREDPGIPDPELTPLGCEQARAAAEALAGAGIDRIVVSPYTRALQTAAPIARALGVPVRVTPLVRERYHFVCDVGTERTRLAACWPEHDFGALPETWWPERTETEESVAARVARFRDEMLDGPHRTTLLVSHWAFLLALTGRSFANGEWLAFDLETVAARIAFKSAPALAPTRPPTTV